MPVDEQYRARFFDSRSVTTDINEITGAAMILRGDCIEVMRGLREASIDAVVTDPPYGLEFMGQEWDAPWKDKAIVTDPAAEGGAQDGKGGNAYSRSRVRYQGTATARASREAERADPVKAKYLDHSVEYDRRPGALYEWHLSWAREANRVLKPGGYMLAMSGTRTYHRLACAVEDAGFEIRDMIAWMYGSGFPKSHNLDGEHEGWGTALKPAHEPIVVARKLFAGTIARNMERHGTGAMNVDGCRIGSGGRCKSTDKGRWPANVAMDPEAARVLDGQSGDSQSPFGVVTQGGKTFGGTRERGGTAFRCHGDSGGASRFFYVAKPSAHERSAGVPEGRNVHPTVKPIELMRWLCRLVTPPDGLILDPFLGSGTTAIAATLERFEWLGIERDPAYAEIAEARAAWWRVNRERGWQAKPAPETPGQMKMWGEDEANT